MRKVLTLAAVIAGALGLVAPALAVQTPYDIQNGEFSPVEHSCTQIVRNFGSTDCTFGRTRPLAFPFDQAWIGPLFGAGHYTVGSPQDSQLYVGESGGGPRRSDGKIAAPVTGTLTLDDQGTVSPTDDTFIMNFSIGALARNIRTGQFARSVERFDSFAHVVGLADPVVPNNILPIPVNSAVANLAGGVDYVIGSRGVPSDTQLCRDLDPDPNDFVYDPDFTNCFPTDGISGEFADPLFYAYLDNVGVSVERSGTLGDPATTATVPGTAGNIGAVSVGTLTNWTCSTTTSGINDDCLFSPILWGAGVETPGFDNIVARISTNAAGVITSARLYWTQEYRINNPAGQPPPDNSAAYGSITFAATPQNLSPTATDDAATVVLGTGAATLNVLANDVNFVAPLTVTIETPPAAGTATPNLDGTISYTPAGGATPGTVTFDYRVTDNNNIFGVATVTLTLEADTSPNAPDGTLTVSTQGRAPASVTTGNVVTITTLPGFASGNGSPVITITSSPANGTATVVGGNQIRFVPGATFFQGVNTIGYTVTDADNDTDTGAITVTVTDVLPTLTDGTIEVDESQSDDTTLALVLGNGSLAQHTVVVSSQGSGGSCTISSTTATTVNISYEGDPDFFGADSCEITVTDESGAGDAVTATVDVTVNEVDDEIRLPGGGGAVDPWSLLLLGALPLLRRRRPS
jgi:hypothetical protein